MSRVEFLSTVEGRYLECKNWALGLSNSSDREYFTSKGYKGLELLIILYFFLPLCWVLETGFNGVPFIVSFFKRRLKRRGPKKRSNPPNKEGGLVKKITIKKVRCCKGCKSQKTLDRIRELKAQPVKVSKNAKRNMIRRFRKRENRYLASQSVMTEIVDLPHVEPKERLSSRKERRRVLFKNGELNVKAEHLIHYFSPIYYDSVAWKRITFAGGYLRIDRKPVKISSVDDLKKWVLFLSELAKCGSLHGSVSEMLWKYKRGKSPLLIQDKFGTDFWHVWRIQVALKKNKINIKNRKQKEKEKKMEEVNLGGSSSSMHC